jgi:hypothetical protein
MNRFRRCCLVVVCLGSLSTFALAQNPPAAAPPSQTATPRGPRANPTNIKALPKNITGDEIHEVMHKYEADLGVECEYCHARNPETRRNDFPSDANPVKDKARLMIKMTEEINTRYLAQLADHKADQTVTCATCHRGTAHPEAFVPKQHAQSTPPQAAH